MSPQAPQGAPSDRRWTLRQTVLIQMPPLPGLGRFQGDYSSPTASPWAKGRRRYRGLRLAGSLRLTPMRLWPWARLRRPLRGLSSLTNF